MKILKMHATFGNLHEQTLELASGMNIFCGANETGKSTWSAFLRVMLYGISTREKSRTGFLADKEKYAPWSGAPMYGKIEFLWRGKHLLLERRSGKNGVLQKAKIQDLDTGEELSIPDPVGVELLGVRREVFERSAFIAQAQLALSGDKTGEMERRITALSTTGEEDFSQKQTLERLEKWKRKLQYHQKGEIPELIARRQNTEGLLHEARRDAAQMTAYHTQMEALTQQEQEAKKAIVHAKAYAARRELDYMDRVEKERSQCANELKALEDSRPLTAEQYEQIAEISKQYEESKDKYTECTKKMRCEQEKLRSMTPVSTGRGTQLFAAAGCALVVFVALFFVQWIVAVIAGVAALGVSYGLFCRLLYRKYGVKNRRELLEKDEQYYCQQQVVRICEEQCKDSADRLDVSTEKLTSVLRMLDIRYTAEDAKLLLQNAAVHEEEITRTRQRLGELTARAEAAQVGRDRTALLQLVENAPQGAKAPDEDEEMLQRRIEALRTERERKSASCAALGERIEARGDLGMLENTIQELSDQICEKQRDLMALTLAIETVTGIQAEMQRKFAPQVEKRAGELFAAFTGGHFRVVQIQDAELSLSVSEQDAAPPRSVLELSQGTLDELYLAVRLALCETILPDDVPIVLDDALVNFDDTRAERALSLLREFAERRQVLVFSCHQREATFAERHGIYSAHMG